MINKNKKILIAATIILVVISVIVVLFVVNYNRNGTSKESRMSSEDNSLSETNPLFGTWEYSDGTKYEFDEDMTGGMYVGYYKYEYIYKITDDVIAIDFANEEVHDAEYSYEIIDGKLKLVGGEGTAGGEYVLGRVSN